MQKLLQPPNYLFLKSFHQQTYGHLFGRVGDCNVNSGSKNCIFQSKIKKINLQLIAPLLYISFKDKISFDFLYVLRLSFCHFVSVITFFFLKIFFIVTCVSGKHLTPLNPPTHSPPPPTSSCNFFKYYCIC